MVVIGGCVLAFNKFSSGKKTTKEVQDVDSIEGYDYTLKDNATKYYKSLFEELKKTLEADDIDEEKYAELVAQMFVADFFNLDNKISKSDVGGTQFVYSDYVNDFQNYLVHQLIHFYPLLDHKLDKYKLHYPHHV